MTTPVPLPLRQFILACIALELLSLGGRLVGLGEGLRNALIAIGGFWPGLLAGMSPQFPGQEIAMFATSAVLHGGPLHLAMNMVGLMWLGPMIVDRLGDRGFWPLAGLSALGAGTLYALLATSNLPMVGASGVLYGLLGAIAVWVALDHRAQGRTLRPYALHAAVFLGLNILLTVSASGAVAWEAHLGGFIAGAACGLLTWRNTFRAA
jgi:rhomboid protease GluP